jgi:hypothetical protein
MYEVELVRRWGGLDVLYNIMRPGRGGGLVGHTEETKRKISKANLGKKRSKESRKRMSKADRPERSEAANVKVSNSLKGRKRKPFSIEHCRNISKAKKGISLKPLSDEHRKKLSEAAKGRVFSDSHRAKLSEAKRGKKRNSEQLSSSG